MKFKAIVRVFLIDAILIACTPATPATIPPRADNFAFVFYDFACSSIPVNVLDSANSTLVYTPLGDTVSTTISLRLSEEELESIYQKAMSIGFFEYPSKFVVPENQVLGYLARIFSYQLRMTNGERINSVSWTDDAVTKPSYTKDDDLRELLNLINEILRSHPEVHQLPEPKALCI
jgi:hypothetical protein